MRQTPLAAATHSARRTTRCTGVFSPERLLVRETNAGFGAEMLLHLTNGRAIIPAIGEAAIPGTIVPWDDVLHEGPVPAGLNAAALRSVRADFLATFVAEAPPSRDDIARTLTERDAALEEALRPASEVEEVVLWLEHDLYDQLHLIQILDRLSADGAPLVTAVAVNDYLGDQPIAQFKTLFKGRKPIAPAQWAAARDAWTAFRSADPRELVHALPRVLALPHLVRALERHLQQFPSVENGLSRTEQQALEAVAAGVAGVADIYVASHHQREEAIFMGDAAFLFHLGALLNTPRPLLEIVSVRAPGLTFLSLADEIGLTDEGRRVLEGRADRVDRCGIDRWLGGVHLTGHGPVWRWDQERQAIRRG